MFALRRAILSHALFCRIRHSALARNTGWGLLAQGGRLGLQAASLVLIARALGAEGYGTLAAALAIVWVLAPFAGWGAGNLLIMHVARDTSAFAPFWGNAILTIVLSGAIFTVVAVAVGHSLVPSIPWQLLFGLAIAEFFFGRLADVAAQAYQAVDRMVVSTWLNLLPMALRLAAVGGMLVASPRPSPETWAAWYLASTVLAALVAAVVVTRGLGRPRFAPALMWRYARTSGYFAVSQASAGIYADIDKAMLARLATLEATGIYAAAYRATAMAFVPVRSLLFASYARFFKHGQGGIRRTLDFAKTLVPFSLLAGVAACVGLLVFAPLAPIILGSDYNDSVGALRWLALLPLLQSVHYLAADTLTGAGHQGLRSAMQALVAVFNVGLNLWLIPDYGWKGAAWATLVSDATLATLLWVSVFRLLRRSNTPDERDRRTWST